MRLRYVALALAGYALGMALAPSAKADHTPSSWTPPLARELHETQRHSEPSTRPRFDGVRRPGAAARWITEAALMTLQATGIICGGGRDDTADVGRIPPRFPNDPQRNPNWIQGHIR